MRKTILIVISVVIIGLLVLGFMKNPNNKGEKFISRVEQSDRIKVIVTVVENGLSYSIIEVDNHEYVSTEGGIIHSESCPCKNKQN